MTLRHQSIRYNFQVRLRPLHLLGPGKKRKRRLEWSVVMVFVALVRVGKVREAVEVFDVVIL